MSTKIEHKKELVLASGSKNRIQALTMVKIPFVSIPSNVDEKAIRDPNIYKQVARVAKAKVDAVSKKHAGIILGADGVNLCKGRVLEKPANHDEATYMLQLQSGQICSFLTGFYLLNTRTGKSYTGHSETVYKFRTLSNEEIEEYIRTEPVFTWAAAFSPGNSSALSFIEYIHGSYSNFSNSMPFDKLIPLLQREKVIH